MAGFDLQIPERNFDCGNCGRCCRNWHVELMPADIKRLEKLDWREDDPKADTYIMRHNGKTVLSHKEGNWCIFYDIERKGCMLHRRFGYESKPVGCRLYPFQLATTFSNTVSATIRFECPSVRLNQGKAMRKRQGEFRGIAGELGMPGKGFDMLDLDNLHPEKCREIVEALVKHLIDDNSLPAMERLILCQKAVGRIEKLGAVFINEMDMSDIFPSFFERLIQDGSMSRPRRLGALEQARFLSLFTSFMRRDEEQADKGLGGRFQRALTLFRLLNGKVNLRNLSEEHPDFAIGRAEFFSVAVENLGDDESGILFDLFRQRLLSYQFFGKAVYNRSFFFGLGTLFLLGALVVALAKWHALARQGRIEPCSVSTEDMANATSAVHHAYGRSGLLGLNFMNTLQRQICEPAAFERIIHETLNGKAG